MDTDSLSRRCFYQKGLTDSLAQELGISPIRLPVYSETFAGLKDRFERGSVTFWDLNTLKQMVKVAKNFDESLYIYQRSKYISGELHDHALRVLASLAATFEENFLVYTKSVSRPSVVSPENVLDNLATIGTFEDWLSVYFNHRNWFDYTQFHNVAIREMARLLKS